MIDISELGSLPVAVACVGLSFLAVLGAVFSGTFSKGSDPVGLPAKTSSPKGKLDSQRARNMGRRKKVSNKAEIDGDEVTSERDSPNAIPQNIEPAPPPIKENDLEVWEIPLELGKPDTAPTESEKALLKVVKKLREVKRLEMLISSGASVEPNQRAKAAKREELIQEWSNLYSDVMWEREHEGSSREFVTVKSGVPASRLRSEAARLIEEEAAMMEAAAARVKIDAVAPTSSSKKPSRAEQRRKAKARAAGAEDEEGAWITVGNDGKPKEKPRVELTQEEREVRQASQVAIRAMKVQSTMTDEYKQTRDSILSAALFSPSECEEIERLIDQVVIDAERGLFKEHTVDLTPMRNKYFFGFAYTYGAQKEHPGAHGIEAVWPPEDTSEIPTWISEMIIPRLEARRIVPKGWINSATINDYAAGGCIVSHIDPPHLFDRPIISISFFSDCNLVFGTRFAFPKEAKQDIETSTPVLVHPCLRGNATVLKGYSANKITHAIRPCDLPSRRASIILRRVLPSAPVLVGGKVVPVSEHLKQRGK